MDHAEDARMIRTIAALAAVAAHTSWHALPLSNGFAAAVYDPARARVTSLREHLYARPDATSVTRELMYDAYFGLRASGANVWLGESSVDEAGWDPEAAGVARVVQHAGDLRATQYFFAPSGVDAPALVAIVTVTNTGAAPLADAALFSLHNLHLGSGADGTQGESIVWQGGAFEERGEGARGVLVRPLGAAPTHHAATPANPYLLVKSGAHLVDSEASGIVDDAVSGFEWDVSGLLPGASRTFGLVIAVAPDGDRAALDAQLAPLASTPEAALANERAGWTAFFARAHEPGGLSVDERAVYRRQLAVLRMAQVREPGGAFGQIVASPPPGGWNITWVRDQAYAVRALVRAGLFAEARAALAFVLGGRAGAYQAYVGAPYAISVCRYFGNGDEESDSDARGPNVEFDGFGLTLGALAEYVAASGDRALVDGFADAIFARTADVLMRLVEPGGLVAADSSIWESHWEQGGRQHYAYTQATAAWGLRAAARLADAGGTHAAAAAAYAAAADTIAAALAARLVDPATRVLRGSLEQVDHYLDAAVVEAFDLDVLPADGAVANATLDALRASLWLPATGHGYRRNDDGGSYDEREWIVVDLRVAQAARRAGRPEEAAALLAWITAQARANLDLVPENFDPASGDFLGAVPMAGFGAGAYVLALFERADAEVPPGPEPPDAGLPAGTDAGAPAVPSAGSSGCGCRVAPAASPGRTSMWLLIWLLLVGRIVVAARRRSWATRPHIRTLDHGGDRSARDP
jgi:MYXO-CTERM domain-containing protein